MTEIINAKVVNHHALEKDWQNIDYIPEVGEIVFYDAEIDENGQPDVSKAPEGREPIAYTRQKNGDGVHNVKDLPFASVEGGKAPTQIVQSDWNEKDEQSGAFIKNKPEIPTIPEAIKNPNAFELFDNNGLVGEYDGSAPMTLVAGNNIVLDVIDAESNIIAISAFGEGGGSIAPADGTTYGLVRGGDGDVEINEGVITLNKTDGLTKMVVEEFTSEDGVGSIRYFDPPHPEAEWFLEGANIIEAQGTAENIFTMELDTENLADGEAYVTIEPQEYNQYFDFELSYFHDGETGDSEISDPDIWFNLPDDIDGVEYSADFSGMALKDGPANGIKYDPSSKEYTLPNGIKLSSSNLEIISSKDNEHAAPDILRLTIPGVEFSAGPVTCWFWFVAKRRLIKKIGIDSFSGKFEKEGNRLKLTLGRRWPDGYTEYDYSAKISCEAYLPCGLNPGGTPRLSKLEVDTLRPILKDSIEPDIDEVRNFGSSSKKWKDIYALNLHGQADSAINDEFGRVIVDTYVDKDTLGELIKENEQTNSKISGRVWEMKKKIDFVKAGLEFGGDRKFDFVTEDGKKYKGISINRLYVGSSRKPMLPGILPTNYEYTIYYINEDDNLIEVVKAYNNIDISWSDSNKKTIYTSDTIDISGLADLVDKTDVMLSTKEQGLIGAINEVYARTTNIAYPAATQIQNEDGTESWIDYAGQKLEGIALSVANVMGSNAHAKLSIINGAAGWVETLVGENAITDAVQAMTGAGMQLTNPLRDGLVGAVKTVLKEGAVMSAGGKGLIADPDLELLYYTDTSKKSTASITATDIVNRLNNSGIGMGAQAIEFVNFDDEIIATYDGSKPLRILAGNTIDMCYDDEEGNNLIINTIGEGGAGIADGATLGLVRGGGDGDVSITDGYISINHTEGLTKTITKEFKYITEKREYDLDYPHPEAELVPDSAKLLSAHGMATKTFSLKRSTVPPSCAEDEYFWIGRDYHDQYFDFPISLFDYGPNSPRDWYNVPTDAHRIEYSAKINKIVLENQTEDYKPIYDDFFESWLLPNGVKLTNENLQLIASSGEEGAVPDTLRLYVSQGSSKYDVPCAFQFTVTRTAYRNTSTEAVSCYFTEIRDEQGEKKLKVTLSPGWSEDYKVQEFSAKISYDMYLPCGLNPGGTPRLSKLEVDVLRPIIQEEIEPEFDSVTSFGSNKKRWKAIYANNFYGMADGAVRDGQNRIIANTYAENTIVDALTAEVRQNIALISGYTWIGKEYATPSNDDYANDGIHKFNFTIGNEEKFDGMRIEKKWGGSPGQCTIYYCKEDGSEVKAYKLGYGGIEGWQKEVYKTIHTSSPISLENIAVQQGRTNINLLTKEQSLVGAINEVYNKTRDLTVSSVPVATFDKNSNSWINTEHLDDSARSLLDKLGFDLDQGLMVVGDVAKNIAGLVGGEEWASAVESVTGYAVSAANILEGGIDAIVEHAAEKIAGLLGVKTTRENGVLKFYVEISGMPLSFTLTEIIATVQELKTLLPNKETNKE